MRIERPDASKIMGITALTASMLFLFSIILKLMSCRSGMRIFAVPLTHSNHESRKPLLQRKRPPEGGHFFSIISVC